MKRRSLLALSVACVALLQAAAAHGEITYQTSFGSEGSGAGQFNQPASVSINNSTGDVYVADNGNDRIQQFTEDGDFVRAWGYDVVASGGDDKPLVDEVDLVKIRATGGTFKLSFNEQTTGPLAFDAPASTVEAALNGLSSISAGGGSVDVTEAPGDAAGSNPYVVTFNGGPLQKTDAALGLDVTLLALPPETELSCKITGTSSGPPGSSTSGWRTATRSPARPRPPSPPVPRRPARPSSVGSSRPSRTATRPWARPSPTGSAAGSSTTAPPVGPSTVFAPTSTVKLKVNEAKGATLTCNAGSWTGSPENYTYRWYRNGIEIGSPPPRPPPKARTR